MCACGRPVSFEVKGERCCGECAAVKLGKCPTCGQVLRKCQAYIKKPKH